MVYILQKKYSIEYNAAVHCHQKQTYQIPADGQTDDAGNHCTSADDDESPSQIISNPIPSNTLTSPPARKRCQPCPQVRRGKRIKRKVTYLAESI